MKRLLILTLCLLGMISNSFAIERQYEYEIVNPGDYPLDVKIAESGVTIYDHVLMSKFHDKEQRSYSNDNATVSVSTAYVWTPDTCEKTIERPVMIQDANGKKCFLYKIQIGYWGAPCPFVILTRHKDEKGNDCTV